MNQSRSWLNDPYAASMPRGAVLGRIANSVCSVILTRCQFASYISEFSLRAYFLTPLSKSESSQRKEGPIGGAWMPMILALPGWRANSSTCHFCKAVSDLAARCPNSMKLLGSSKFITSSSSAQSSINSR